MQIVGNKIEEQHSVTTGVLKEQMTKKGLSKNFICSCSYLEQLKSKLRKKPSLGKKRIIGFLA